MVTRRKTAVPVVENIFTDELPVAAGWTFQSEEKFFAGAAKRVRDFQEGRRTKAFSRESFELPESEGAG
jgi:hypothetical protein